MKKKIFSFVLVLCFALPCIFSLSACGKKDNTQPETNAKFTSAKNISSNTETIISNLTNKVYNSSTLGKSTTYTVAQIQEKIDDFEYYVELGTITGTTDVDSITLGNATFDSEQTFNLSVGNANYISDKCFKTDDSKLYVAAPIVAFETVNNKKIKINDSEFNFDLEKTAETKSFTNAEFSSGSTNTLTKKENNSYDIQFKDAKSYLKLFYENAAANDVVLTKKVITNSKNESSNNSIGYGLTKVEAETNYPLALYPIGYSESALTETTKTTYDGTTMNFQAYVAEKGVFTITLNLSITLPTAE